MKTLIVKSGLPKWDYQNPTTMNERRGIEEGIKPVEAHLSNNVILSRRAQSFKYDWRPSPAKELRDFKKSRQAFDMSIAGDVPIEEVAATLAKSIGAIF